MANIFVKYYQGLLGTKENCRTKACEAFLRSGQQLSTGQQMDLLQPYSSLDVKKPMFGVYVNKSPGADGYGSGFFKASKNIIGDDVTRAVLMFIENGKLLMQWSLK